MQLQRIVSEISKVEDLLTPIRDIFDKCQKVTEVKTIEDIENLNHLVVLTYAGVMGDKVPRVAIDQVISHANVLKPFISYSEKDFFI